MEELDEAGRGPGDNSPTRARGVTLLELLCALAVLALLLSIAVPAVAARLPALAGDQAARRIVSDLALWRLRAIAGDARMRATFELDRARYWVESDTGGGFVQEGTERDLPAGISFDAAASTRVSGNLIRITFQPRGNTFDSATIALAAARGVSRQVIINAAGRVRWQ